MLLHGDSDRAMTWTPLVTSVTPTKEDPSGNDDDDDDDDDVRLPQEPPTPPLPPTPPPPPSMAARRKKEMGMLFLATVVDMSLLVSIIGFLAMHANLIAKNRTTIEMFEKPFEYENTPREHGAVRRRGGSSGTSGAVSRLILNCEEVFGTRPSLWLLPMHADCDLRSQLLNLNPRPYISSSAIYDRLLRDGRRGEYAVGRGREYSAGVDDVCIEITDRAYDDGGHDTYSFGVNAEHERLL